MNDETSSSLENERRLVELDGKSDILVVLKIEACLTQVGNDNVLKYNLKHHGQPHERTQTPDDEADDEAQEPMRKIQMSGPSLETRYSDESDNSAQKQKAEMKSKRRDKLQNKKMKDKPEVKSVQTVHKSLAPASPSASYSKFIKISDGIMRQLQAVRDNGRWETVKNLADTLLGEYQGYLEAQAIIYLEKGLAACYNNRLEESKDLMKKAAVMSVGTQNSFILIGRAHYYLSAVYRRQKRTGKSIDCVVIAKQNLHNINQGKDTCSLAYEEGSALMDFILQCPDPPLSLIDKVKADLKKCIDMANALQEQSSNLRYIKTHHYAFMAMVMLLLDCRTGAGRKRTVSQENIKEAKKYLDTLKEGYLDKTSWRRGEEIQFFLCQSDLHFRMELFQQAEEDVLKALHMAEEFGFNTEIKPANDRLEEIRLSRSLKFQGAAKLKFNVNIGNTAPDVYADGSHENIAGENHNISPDVYVDGDNGNPTSEVYSDGNYGNTATESGEGNFGDKSASSDSDWLNSQAFL